VALAIPITLGAKKETKRKVTEAPDKVNYKGMLTYSPTAIEKAIYELKRNG